MHILLLVYFVKVYMFREYLGPSSGGTTVCIQQMVLILFRWLSLVLDRLELKLELALFLLKTNLELDELEFQSIQDKRQSSKKNNKYHLLYTYGCTSWWWAYIRPKHVQVDEYTKNKLCIKLVFLYTIISRWGSKYIKFIFIISCNETTSILPVKGDILKKNPLAKLWLFNGIANNSASPTRHHHMAGSLQVRR